MKVLYISSSAYFDFDLSFIRSLSEKVELVYLMNLPNHGLKTTTLQIEKQKIESNIISIDNYPELNSFSNYLKCDAYVINRPVSKFFSLETVKLYTIIKKFIKKENPDIIHYNGIQRHGILPVFFNKVKKIITVHDPLPHIGEDTLVNKIMRKINFFYIHNIILLNKIQLNEFSIKYNIPLSKIFLSSIGAYEYYNENFFLSKSIKSDKNKILFFGRITPYKGIDILLKAFEEVQKKLPDTTLTIAGKGEFNFKQYTTKNVSFLNRYIPNEELFQLIRESSFVVCPYIEATQSGVVMTAFSLEKPVLVTNVGGLPEMVDHNKTGLVCEPNDSEKLSDAILSMLINPETLINYSKNIRKIHFGNGIKGWQSITNNIYNFYNSI